MAFPTDYSPEKCTEITRLMAGGLTDTEVMAKWGISRSTFYRWKKEHPEFKTAHEIGKAQCEANHIELGRKGMLKELDMDYQYWRDLGKYCHNWTDKAAGNTNNTQINIDNMNVLNEQTNEELLMYIKSQMEQNPELQHIIDGEIVNE